MNKEKQIEEMAELMCDEFDNGVCKTDRCMCNHNCYYHNKAAVNLYNEGYRKQKEGEWIITNNRNLEIIRECSNCHAKTYYPMELKFNCRKSRYCEDCGAEMKGE